MTMYTFVFHWEVGDVCLAEIEGEAALADGGDGEWYVSEVYVFDLRGDRARLDMKDKAQAALADLITEHIIQNDKHECDVLWAEERPDMHEAYSAPIRI